MPISIDHLPEITMEGKLSFGFLINGQAFIPKGSLSSSAGKCYYQKIYSSDIGYFFVVDGVRDESNCQGKQVVLSADSLKLEQGKTYTLGSFGTGKCYAKYFLAEDCSIRTTYRTNNLIAGEMSIIFLDTVNQIISGTFWFNAISPAGYTVHISDGRFDKKYQK